MVPLLITLHDGLYRTGMIYSAIVGLWALYVALRKRELDPSFWGALAINEIIFVAQALVGTGLWLEGLRPARTVHLLYGVLAVITVPAAFAFTRGRGTQREALLYGLVCLFLAGVAQRAAATAAG